jgi:hypothetical protein
MRRASDCVAGGEPATFSEYHQSMRFLFSLSDFLESHFGCLLH